MALLVTYILNKEIITNTILTFQSGCNKLIVVWMIDYTSPTNAIDCFAPTYSLVLLDNTIRHGMLSFMDAFS